jgi:hypothetical protein
VLVSKTFGDEKSFWWCYKNDSLYQTRTS